MPGATDAEEAAILNGRLDALTLWLGVSSTTPADNGTGATEPSGGGYARVQIDGAGGAWSAATGTAPVTKATSGDLSLPTATADWSAGANQTHFVLYDAATEGALRYFDELATPKPVFSGDTLSFAAGDLQIQLGDPGDSFA